MAAFSQPKKQGSILYRGIALPLLLVGALLIPPGSYAEIATAPAPPREERVRARDLGLAQGQFQPGPSNAITDVSGVRVGHTTLIEGHGELTPGEGPIRTGVTVIIPRRDVWHRKVPAGAFVLNGTGEMTGLAWVAEAGFLEYPIALTNTLNVPRVADAIITWMIDQYPGIGITDDTLTPVVAECDDSRLNDIQGRHVSEEDVLEAFATAATGPVQEGTEGAGTGMIAYGFKGGIGTASRRLPSEEGAYTVGVLVNANHGRREELVMSGVPVGRLYAHERGENAAEKRLQWMDETSGSIIIIIATDAPLNARQLERLAKRASHGLARTGATSHHGSGDFILAFSTATTIPHYPEEPTYSTTVMADTHLDPLFTATVEATEESILNALTTATTVIGRDRRRAEAISLERLREILAAYPHVEITP